MLPVLSGDGSLSFPDAESVATACKQLRAGGHFEVQAEGTPPPGLMRLRIRLPDSLVPLVHTAAVRAAKPGRMSVGMSGAEAVIQRLERAALTMGQPAAAPRATAAERPRTTAAPSEPGPNPPRAAAVFVQPARSTGPRAVVSLSDLDPLPPLEDLPRAPAVPPVSRVAPKAPVSTPAAHADAPSTPNPPRVVEAPRRATGERPPAAAPASASPRVDLEGMLVRQPQVNDLRSLFTSTVDRSSLGATHLGDLLRFLSTTRATGRLILVGPRRKTFWLREGDLGPSEAEPPRTEDTLGRLVIKMGKLTSAAPVEEAVATARRRRIRTGEVLIEMGVLDAAQLGLLLCAQTEARLLHAAEWSQAEFQFVREPFPAGAISTDALRSAVALARYVVERATAAQLQTCVEAIQQLYVRLAPMPNLEESALLGDDRAARTLRYAFPGTHRLREALGACPLGKVPTLRMLVLLHAYGVLDADAAPLVLAAGKDPVASLRHRVLQARGHDPFRRLGAHAAMAPDQIQDSYARTMGECGPGGPWERIDGEAAEAMAGMLEQSFRSLHDKEIRTTWRRRSLGPERSRWVAELLCTHAQVLRNRGDGQRARVLAEVAIELHDSAAARKLTAGG